MMTFELPAGIETKLKLKLLTKLRNKFISATAMLFFFSFGHKITNYIGFKRSLVECDDN